MIWMVESNEIHESTLKNLTSGKNDEYLIAALGDEEREVTFYTRKDKPHTEGNSYYKEVAYWDIPQLVQTSTMKLRRLDDIFTEETIFEIVKLDTVVAPTAAISPAISPVVVLRASGVLAPVVSGNDPDAIA